MNTSEDIENIKIIKNQYNEFLQREPDNVGLDHFLKLLSNKKINHRLIFDGYPRNLNQAKELDLLARKNNQKISCVLSLEVDRETIIKRILGRQICSKCKKIFNEYFYPSTEKNHSCDIKFLQKRSDDSEKIARNRFETYTKETLPVLDYYQNLNLLYEIDGSDHIHEIYKEIRQIIDSLEA